MMLIKKLFHETSNWINDPFGRKELTEKHEEVLGRMRETTAVVSTISQRRFPISKMVGNTHAHKRRRSVHDAR